MPTLNLTGQLPAWLAANAYRLILENLPRYRRVPKDQRLSKNFWLQPERRAFAVKGMLTKI